MAPKTTKAARGPFADKLWREALRRAVLKRVGKDQRLDIIAEKVVSAAVEGKMDAAKEIGDRLDGKPAQAIIGGDDDQPAVRVINEIRRTVVDPRSSDR